jgi:hypothetical protein
VDFGGAAGKRLGWQEGDHGRGRLLSSGGLVGNEEVRREEVPSPSPPLSYAGTSSAVSRNEEEAPGVHRSGDLVHAIVPELE